ncbi:PREDICTED: uncharacterized protein LOC105564259 isoform X3 [Vollenhovia emeryi]|uniref:uncharacterized protein LOC105564259 isoform X3 n=1 Tax=Vollenhovia emeryi TaxID=411798 RepID=UPI0005F44399|nr:PREDICTED: uncharacterized protein LOC105564259 isoform X3 [Vollenhovia emeryi]
MLPSLVSKQVFVLVVLRYFAYSMQQWDSGLRQRYDGYGEDWIFMPDGNGQPQVAVLKIQDNERSGVLDYSEIAYIIYTRSNPKQGTRVVLNNSTNLAGSDFKSSRKTKFITHGWKSSAMSAGLLNMKDAFLTHGDYNVVLVDWEPLAASTFYLGPMHNTVRVGTDAAKFIDFLVKETGLKTEDVHFIGKKLPRIRLVSCKSQLHCRLSIRSLPRGTRSRKCGWCDELWEIEQSNGSGSGAAGLPHARLRENSVGSHGRGVRRCHTLLRGCIRLSSTTGKSRLLPERRYGDPARMLLRP